MHDLDQLGNEFSSHIKDVAKSNGPSAVLLTVVDGSGQSATGYVWCTHGDKTVQCIAPMTVGDLRTATTAAPMVIWALPPNPDEASGFYIAFGFAENGAASNGFPAGRVPPISSSVVNDPDGNPVTGSGTVTSVALTAAPSGVFDVSGSPITGAGALALSMDSQTGNKALMSPSGGGSGTPGFRALEAADIPDISSTYIAKAFMAAKGDLITATANDTPVIQTVGSNETVLVADSAQTNGIKWATRATPALDNLASVAINTSLVSDTDNTDNLGSAAIKWAAVFANLLALEERAAPSTPASGDVNVYPDTSHNMRQISSLGMDDLYHRGDYSIASQFAIGTGETAMISKSIKASSLSTKGWIYTRTVCTVLNAAGANRTHSHTYNFGAYAFVIAPSTAQATNAANRRVYVLDVWTYNDQAQNSQIHVFHYVNRGAAAAATAPAAATDDVWGWDVSAITTTSDITVSQTIKSNNATGTQTAYAIGDLTGPYSGS